MSVSVRSSDAMSQETSSEMPKYSDGGRPFLPQPEDPAAFCRSGTAQGPAEEGTHTDQPVDPAKERCFSTELLLNTCAQEQNQERSLPTGLLLR